VTRARGTRRWPALALLRVAQFVAVLDVTIVAIALPAIQESLGFSRVDLQWVVSAYTLVFGGFLLFAGRAVDLYGRRLFVIGFALFSGASLACGLAFTARPRASSRRAGTRGGDRPPSALSALTAIFPKGAGRERALGVWTAAAGGGAAGWVLGGVLTQGFGWEWVFLVNVPVGVLGLAPTLVPESHDRTVPPRLDAAAGAVTVTA
jgi:MFS family permease